MPRPCDVTPQMRYDMQLDMLLARYAITEADYMTYVLPRIPPAHEMNIARAEQEIRRFREGLK